MYGIVLINYSTFSASKCIFFSGSKCLIWSVIKPLSALSLPWVQGNEAPSCLLPVLTPVCHWKQLHISFCSYGYSVYYTHFNLVLMFRMPGDMPLFAIRNTNLIHTSHFTVLRFRVSTCFGHYLPILRRHYTNAGSSSHILRPAHIYNRTQQSPTLRLCSASWGWASNTRNMSKLWTSIKWKVTCVSNWYCLLRKKQWCVAHFNERNYV
jgi:hypothetical protein